MDPLHVALGDLSQTLGHIYHRVQKNHWMPQLRYSLEEREKEDQLLKEYQQQLQQQPKPATCGLFLLPNELFDLIIAQLDARDRFYLARTCHVLRCRLWSEKDLKTVTARTPLWNYIDFLAMCARDMPDYWACERCLTLHRVSMSDVPEYADEGRREAAAQRYGAKHAGYYAANKAQATPQLSHIEQRHVHLALKYARTPVSERRPYQQLYLDRLMSPSRNVRHQLTLPQTHAWPLQHPRRQRFVHCTYLPKIVRSDVSDSGGGRRLRFLLLTVLRFEHQDADAEDPTQLSVEDMGCLVICPHLELNHEPPEWATEAQRSWQRQRALMRQQEQLRELRRAERELRRQQRLGLSVASPAPPLPPNTTARQQRHRGPRYSPYANLDSAVREAFGRGRRALHDDEYSPDNCIEVTGRCPRCPTDFAVRAARRAAEVRVWQDYGPEEGPSNIAWVIHLTGQFDDNGRVWQNQWGISPVTQAHKKGSVRKLYEDPAAAVVDRCSAKV
ncbi:f-box domain containing protein [Niveomyces insectorum RCEF 264]|uniref:F-box domain containing protein n=1 Tax=Niveomyces insectorum RCEF 264 TaxID=1081102 RepID=A0A167WDV4_9HYPO|nr:f-box domain containing protein [Niveomyces insectorum RCEF 264]